MSDDRIEGAAREGLGHVQDAVGGLVGNAGVQAKGKLNQAAGSAQGAYGKVKDTALDALDQAGDRAQGLMESVASYGRERPLTALAIGVGVGLAAGLLLVGRRNTETIR
jgi:uncharacterized protein YjbJ (UPF0337 family)